MRAIILGFGLLVLCLLIFFRIAEVNFMKGNVRLEVIVAVAAIVFFFVGLYFNRQSQRSENASSPISKGDSTVDPIVQQKAGLTVREQEVLLKMAEGMSNQEIAAALFLSESTIKTHVSNILFKLDAKRRTQAISIAKKRGIVSA